MRPSRRLLFIALALVSACADQPDSPLAPTPRLAPSGPSRMMVNLPGPYAQISSGILIGCAVTTAGAPVCWGRDGQGQANPPASLLSGISRVVAGDDVTCAFKTTGALQCWGNSFNGANNVPAGLQTGATQLSLASTIGCGVSSAGAVLCWGRFGENAPAVLQSGVTQVAVSQTHRCALKNGGAVCWWQGGSPLRPVPIEAQSGIKQVATQTDDECALTNAGGVICWDRNGVLRSDVPVAAQSGIVQLSTGRFHACALTAAGGVVCWGDNSSGQTNVPPAAQSGITQVSAGWVHTCALTNSGTIVCWGSNVLGESNPPSVAGIARHFSPTATFATPTLNVIDGQQIPLTFTNAQVQGFPSATFKYAFDCTGTGTFGTATTSATGSCTAVYNPDTYGQMTLGGKVIDQDGDYATYEVFVGVIPRSQAALTLYYNVLYSDVANAALLGSFVEKISAARTSLDAGNFKAACGQLGAFVNQARAQRGKGVSIATADAWMAEAGALRGTLACA